MEFRILGPLQAVVDQERVEAFAARELKMLAVLLLAGSKAATIERIIDAMWDSSPPATARRQVYNSIWMLRKRGVDIVADGSGYRILVRREQLDLHVFEDEVADAKVLAGTGRLAEAADAFLSALRLWRGPALAGVSGHTIEVAGARLEECRLAAIEDRFELQLQLGHDRDLVSELAELTAVHPLRERLVGQLMQALHRCGRQAEALAVYQRLRLQLATELGIEPTLAIQELQRAVLRGDAGVRAADPIPAKGVPRQLPAPVRPFVGRAAELKELNSLVEEATCSAPSIAICVISGGGGVGKTALAVHWGHLVSARFPEGQLYINLRGFGPGGVPAGPSAAVRFFLDALDVSPQRVPDGLDAQAALLRSRLAGKRMLLLLDNARDAEQIRPLLPGTEGCLVIVTSRHRLTALCALEGASTVTLGVLPTTDARELLAARLGADRAGREPVAVDEIIACCGSLPLALVIAAARAAARPHLTLAAISADMRESSTLDAFDTSDPGLDIRSVFSWSYAGITTAAARLFRLLGLHPGPDISLAAAASLAGEPVARTRRLLVELARAHLIAEYSQDRYVFHDLLRLFASEQVHNMEGQAQRDTATHRLLDHYLYTAFTADRLMDPHRDPITLPAAQPGAVLGAFTSERDALEWFARERQVLLALIDHAANIGRDTHTYQLDWTLTHYLVRCGQWIDQAAAGRAAVAAAHRSGDPAAQARAHHHLARAHLELGNYDLAHDQLQDAIRLAGDADDLIGQGNAHHILSWVLERKGAHLEALAYATQALSLFEAAGHVMGRARSLNTIGWFHAQLGNHEVAVSFCQSALALHEKLGMREGLAATWHSLGYAQHNLGRYDAALRCYHHALSLFTDLQSRYFQAATLESLGDTHRDLGDLDAAGAAWHRALPILEELNHPHAEQVRAKLDSYSNEFHQHADEIASRQT